VNIEELEAAARAEAETQSPAFGHWQADEERAWEDGFVAGAAWASAAGVAGLEAALAEQVAHTNRARVDASVKEGERLRLEAENERLETGLKQFMRQVDRMDTENNRVDDENKRLREEAETQREVVAMLDHVVTKYRTENERLREEVKFLNEVLLNSKAKNERLREMWDRSGKNDLIEQRDAARRELADLRAGVGALADEYEAVYVRHGANVADLMRVASRIRALLTKEET